MTVNFKEQLKQAISEDDALTVQNLLKQKLAEAYVVQTRTLIEQDEAKNDKEMSVVSTIQSAAKSYGASDLHYNEGAIELTVPNKEAAVHLIDYLDNNDDVDSYDIETSTSDADSKDSAGEGFVDLDQISPDADVTFNFHIFLTSDLVQLNPDYDEEEGEEEPEDQDKDDQGDLGKGQSVKEDFIGAEPYLLEAVRIVVFRKAKKLIKMQCPHGQKWDPRKKKCLRLTSKEIRDRHYGAIKAAKKRRPQLRRIEARRAASLKRRKGAMGKSTKEKK